MTGLTGYMAVGSRIVDAAIPGPADVWPLPDAGLLNEWGRPVVPPAGAKEGLLRASVAEAQLRRAVSKLPLPSRGVLQPTGLAGVGPAALPSALCCANGQADHLRSGAVTARGPLVRLGVSASAELALAGRRRDSPREGARLRAVPKGAGYLCV